MKAIIPILLVAFALSGCNSRCYTCEREVARTSDAPFPGYPVTAVTEFSATEEEADVLNNTLIIEKDTINGVVLTTNIKIKCGR